MSVLLSGSPEEKAKIISELIQSKGPGYNDLLLSIMNSGDPYLSVVSAYALGGSGDQKGLDFLQKLFGSLASQLPEGFKNMDVVQEVLMLPTIMDGALSAYRRSYFAEAKEKLLHLLNVFSMDVTKIGIPQFNELLTYNNKKTMGLFYDALSVCEFSLGNIEKAIEYSSQAISLGEEVGDPQVVKIAYADLAYINIALGNYYTALNLLHESLEIDDQSIDPWRKRNRTVTNLAQLYYFVGQIEQSLEYAEEALDLSRTEKDTYGLARVLNIRGMLLGMIDDAEGAGACLQEALDLSIKELNDKVFQSIVLSNMACLQGSLQNADKTAALLEGALSLALEMGDKSTEATIRINRAFFAMDAGDMETAKQESLKAIELSAEMKDQSTQSDALFILGLIAENHEGDDEQAYEHYKESIRFSESLRKNMMLDDFKISFADSQIRVYQCMVGLCARTGRVDEALEYIERSKSRALVDMLSQTMDSISSKETNGDDGAAEINEVFALKGKLSLLKKKIGSAHLTLIQGGQSGRNEAPFSVEGGPGDFSEDRFGLSPLEELQDLERTYQRTFEELKTKDPEWISLASAESIELKTIQGMIDRETMLLDFYLTDDEIVVILVRSDGTPSVQEIPIDAAAFSEEIFNLFSALENGNATDTRSHSYIRGVRNPLSRMFNLIIGPIASHLEGIRRLIISPHNILHYLPFHALYDETTKKHLIDRFIISYTPSLTTLSLCLRKHASTHPHFEKTALILANSSGDLKYAEEEANIIKAKFTADSVMFNKGDASLEKLVEYSNADIIHVACHGYFRGGAPLFSHILLADADGEATPVYLPDIFNLRLNTSLVTLSGCETGLTQFTGGDELIGMSRAFFYAGTPSLLASLWTVDDKSTSILMERFYEGFLERGEHKSDALAMAMRQIKEMPEYSHPYYWAPFFLSGEWR